MASFSMYIWSSYAIAIGLLGAVSFTAFHHYRKAKKQLFHLEKKRAHDS